MNDAPTGLRFSLNYVERGHALPDSVRFRRRLAALFSECLPSNEDFAGHFQRETGAELPWGSYGVLWTEFLTTGELRDVLDMVTVLAGVLGDRRYVKHKNWLDGVERILAEENMGYRLDELGGIHFTVDQEYERNRNATLQGLGLARYAAARVSFDASGAALDSRPPKTREAIKQIFDANEIAFRLLLGPRVSRLGAAEIEKQLKPLIKTEYAGTSRDSAGLLLNSFADWVNAAHPFRHGQGVEKPDRPPIDLTVMVVSTGTSYLRWLIELDQKLNKAG
jgi:hypothetical protein